MIAMATREASVDGASAKSPPGVASVKPAKGWCVSGHFVLYLSFYNTFPNQLWHCKTIETVCILRATAVQSSPSSLSFRDLLMKEEQRDKSSATAAMAAGSPASTVGMATCAKRVTFKCAEPVNAGKPAGWERQHYVQLYTQNLADKLPMINHHLISSACGHSTESSCLPLESLGFLQVAVLHFHMNLVEFCITRPQVASFSDIGRLSSVTLLWHKIQKFKEFLLRPRLWLWTTLWFNWQ